MSAAGRDEGPDVRVAGDGGVAELRGRDEGVVARAQDERRDRHPIDDAEAAGPVVVVGGVPESVVRRREGLVELADGAHRGERSEVEAPGHGARLAPHPPLEVADEVPFVDGVAPSFQGVDAERQVKGRRHGADRAQGGRRAAAVVAGELEGQIAAERVADDREGAGVPSTSISSRMTAAGIRGQPRVVEPLRQVLGAAAVPLVEQHDVEAGRPRLVGEPAHVVGLARPPRGRAGPAGSDAAGGSAASGSGRGRGRRARRRSRRRTGRGRRGKRRGRPHVNRVIRWPAVQPGSGSEHAGVGVAGHGYRNGPRMRRAGRLAPAPGNAARPGQRGAPRASRPAPGNVPALSCRPASSARRRAERSAGRRS